MLRPLAASTNQHTGRVPPPPTLKLRRSGRCHIRRRHTGRVPPPPTLKHLVDVAPGQLPHEYGEGPPSPYIEAGAGDCRESGGRLHTGRVPPPPTLKPARVSPGRSGGRDTGRVPPPPTLKRHPGDGGELLAGDTGRVPPPPTLKPPRNCHQRTDTRIRGGSPLPLH